MFKTTTTTTTAKNQLKYSFILIILANGGCLKFEDEFIQRCMTIIGGASKHLNMVCTIRTAVSIVWQFALSVVHGTRRHSGLMVTVLDSGLSGLGLYKWLLLG